MKQATITIPKTGTKMGVSITDELRLKRLKEIREIELNSKPDHRRLRILEIISLSRQIRDVNAARNILRVGQERLAPAGEIAVL